MKHVVDSKQFSKAAMEAIFAEALKMEAVKPGTAEADMLKGYVVSTLFYEPSTRTRLSFESGRTSACGHDVIDDNYNTALLV
jgi:aspartate carbamoyltransferase catalytic subunit